MGEWREGGKGDSPSSSSLRAVSGAGADGPRRVRNDHLGSEKEERRGRGGMHRNASGERRGRRNSVLLTRRLHDYRSWKKLQCC